MASTNMKMSLGAGGGVKRVSNISKRSLVINKQVITPKEQNERKKKRNKKRAFDIDDKIEISGDGRMENPADPTPSSRQSDKAAEQSSSDQKPSRRINITV
jgi:hypothetical protein